MEDIKKYWDNEFIHYEKTELNKYGFHEDTVEFLGTVGLMAGKRFKDRSYFAFSFLADFKEEKIDGEKYIRIASTFLGSRGLYIKNGEDHVYYIDYSKENNKLIKDFCNTKIQDYVEFETVKSMISSRYPNVDDDELEGYECAREMIEAFKKIDPAAVYPYSYWANRMLNYAINYFYDEDDKIEAAIKSGKYATSNDAYFDILFNGMDVLETRPHI
ncbi:hypothetical protein E8L90_18195 [Brevibacillus antibioticus]|uniref:Uncharacterized protein n=1 Tax=Brevibacillus antibioticus TaxID=2570228 RepID=A0A4U2YB74_9BACL|nr:SUKH-4 family immunity protein [Brevibacillus antibioticus]TKI57232.1 hypothetical protein E8L90_18195 [Brevibacillus antibioticus]